MLAPLFVDGYLCPLSWFIKIGNRIVFMSRNVIHKAIIFGTINMAGAKPLKYYLRHFALRKKRGRLSHYSLLRFLSCHFLIPVRALCILHILT